MGGKGSGRPSNAEFLNKNPQVQKQNPITTDMFLPNHSGKHDAGILNKIPTKDNDLVNKKYCDNNSPVIDWATNVPLNETDPIFNTWLGDVGSYGLSNFDNDLGLVNLWTDNLDGTIQPTDTANRVLIGGATDNTISALQVLGQTSIDGNILLKDTADSYANWTMASAAADIPSGNGITFTNDQGDGGFRIGTSGETYYFGSQAFFGYADRNNPDPYVSGGFFKVNGVQQFWSNALYFGSWGMYGSMFNFADNGDVAIGLTGYACYSSDTTNSTIPAPFYVSRQTYIDPNQNANWDGTSALQVDGQTAIDNGNLIIGSLGVDDSSGATLQVTGGISAEGSLGLTNTYYFDATTSGNITSMTFTDGILTDVTTL